MFANGISLMYVKSIALQIFPVSSPHYSWLLPPAPIQFSCLMKPNRIVKLEDSNENEISDDKFCNVQEVVSYQIEQMQEENTIDERLQNIKDMFIIDEQV